VSSRGSGAGAALLALSLSGCIDSAAPILTDARPLFGEMLDLQFFSLRKGLAHDPERARYTWTAGRYVHAAGGMNDVGAFSVYPFEAGDLIAQSVPDPRDHRTEYALLHRLTDGVFQIVPIDEDDADATTRAVNCRTIGKSDCRVETREQLFALARATAARHRTDGGLVVLLAPDP
jgi:hypothetical protein